jgi:hypothetical protein
VGLKREGTEQLSIQWELGILDDGYIAGQVTYTERISVSDIDGLKIFKLYEHPEIWKETIEGKKGAQHPEIRPQIEAMKTQVIEYQALAASIKPFEERKDSKGKDTFDLSGWHVSE